VVNTRSSPLVAVSITYGKRYAAALKPMKLVSDAAVPQFKPTHSAIIGPLEVEGRGAVGDYVRLRVVNAPAVVVVEHTPSIAFYAHVGALGAWSIDVKNFLDRTTLKRHLVPNLQAAQVNVWLVRVLAVSPFEKAVA
jgi:hypothetical protein